MVTEISTFIGSNEFKRTSPFLRNKTAILTVDMQKEYCIPGRDPSHPELDTKSFFHSELRNLVIPNQVKIISLARKLNIEVMHTVIESLTQDGRDRSIDHRLSGMNVPKGAEGAELIDEIRPVADEIIIPKTSSGVFNSTNIDYVLRNLDIRFLIIFGIVTDQCVDMAVRDAADRGYLVTMVSDASTTITSERHKNALHAFSGYCRIMSTNDLLVELKKIT